MIEQIPEKFRKEIDFYVQEYGAELSLHDYIAPLQEECFPSLLSKLERREPTWTPEQRVADATKHLFGGHDVLCRGIAKRVVDDDPSELARAASLFARLRLWFGTRNEYNDYDCFAPDMLRALAGGDVMVIERFAEVAPSTVTKGGWESRVIHNGVIAAINRDDRLLEEAISDFEKWKKPKNFIASIVTALRGLVAKDAGLVNDGLTSLLKGSGRIQQLHDLYKLISLETHGMYELARRYHPEMVREFDTTQGLPWDEALCAWVAESDDALPFLDVSSLSVELQRWLVELPFRDALRHDWN
ncbi:hypothetical protein [Botrimarina mediterranea]|uniref:hypothetical protein n=1 Tax=Botrimarina mediterranea TaxID=2528022 RepID=UPI001188E992|nr:hypothetical protein K2D_46670 [Planctomycetes bacterium K2D]